MCMYVNKKSPYSNSDYCLTTVHVCGVQLTSTQNYCSTEMKLLSNYCTIW